MLCSLTNHVPREPVVDRRRGYLYERRVIEEYITEHGKCPHSGEPLAKDDLLPVQGVRLSEPRPPSATSIPGMMALFQNEWDALMRESFELRKQLHDTRQELATALYQQDAACRVIARLVKERDEARALLASARTAGPMAGGATAGAAGADSATPMETDGARAAARAGSTLPTDVAEAMTRTAKALLKPRKKFQPSATLASAAELAALSAGEPVRLHSTTARAVLCMALDPRGGTTLVTGGADKSAVIYDLSTKQELAQLKGHTKAVTRVVWHPSRELVCTASDDATARVWVKADGAGGAYRKHHLLRGHAGPIVGLAMHPSGDYLLSVSADSSWAVWSIETGAALTMVREPSVTAPFTAGELHPDGLLLATGAADGAVAIWGVPDGAIKASFDSHKAQISSLAFSENGYVLASGSVDGVVTLWDLRSRQPVRTMSFDGEIRRVRFDPSGVYLAVCHKTALSIVTQLAEPTVAHLVVACWAHASEHVNDVVFGGDARFVATVSDDRALRVYSSA